MTFGSHLPRSMPSALVTFACLVTASSALAQTMQRIAGDQFVDFAKDKTGLTYYVAKGTLCVVHRPNCGLVGHNGKDHFFPATKLLPAGVTLAGVQLKIFWPVGLNHTDRGGLGSKGSYGASGEQKLQSSPPFFSVHWENACEASTGADWGGLPLTYQISFLINVPNGVQVNGAVPADPASGDVCTAADMPGGRPSAPGPVSPSGWQGVVSYCNATTANVTEYLHIRATLSSPTTGALGNSGPMTEDNIKLQIPPGGVSGSNSKFMTRLNFYKQGTWKITDVYLTPSAISPPNGTVKNAVHLHGLPANYTLPGSLGSPVFDFRGGACL